MAATLGAATDPKSLQNTTLCLACSASLPPLKDRQSPSFKDIYITKCCQRPICPSCVLSNPRFTRYNPCLSCLSGVGAVSSSSQQDHNVDGSVQDSDTFTIGDEYDSGDEKCEPTDPPRNDTTTSGPDSPVDTQIKLQARESPLAVEIVDSTLRYYLKRGDTLQGISLRFGINGFELCRLNHLPISTLKTTPHYLHTREYLVLPSSPTVEEEKERETRRARHAQSTAYNWRIAKAYVALAEDDDTSDMMCKETGEPKGAMGSQQLDSLAIDQYLSDQEWEQNELRSGRSVKIPKFPFASSKDKAVPRRWFSGWG
ncbi:hypothetical protein BD779DRAFT_1494765 [Infundibulicybe gibba]|nr:hypothetical protein BD779DRAFT_1494765 [Infundibulicybe gibba]